MSDNLEYSGSGGGEGVDMPAGGDGRNENAESGQDQAPEVVEDEDGGEQGGAQAGTEGQQPGTEAQQPGTEGDDDQPGTEGGEQLASGEDGDQHASEQAEGGEEPGPAEGGEERPDDEAPEVVDDEPEQEQKVEQQKVEQQEQQERPDDEAPEVVDDEPEQEQQAEQQEQQERPAEQEQEQEQRAEQQEQQVEQQEQQERPDDEAPEVVDDEPEQEQQAEQQEQQVEQVEQQEQRAEHEQRAEQVRERDRARDHPDADDVAPDVVDDQPEHRTEEQSDEQPNWWDGDDSPDADDVAPDVVDDQPEDRTEEQSDEQRNWWDGDDSPDTDPPEDRAVETRDDRADAEEREPERGELKESLDERVTEGTNSVEATEHGDLASGATDQAQRAADDPADEPDAGSDDVAPEAVEHEDEDEARETADDGAGDAEQGAEREPEGGGSFEVGRDDAPVHDDRSRGSDASLDERQREARELLETGVVVAGGLAFLAPNDGTLEAAERLGAYEGQRKYDMHGTWDRVRVGDRWLSAPEFADVVRSDPGWNGGPVLLFSCDTGKSGPNGEPSFGQHLSDELGVPVTAPTEKAWSNGDPFVSAGRELPNGVEVPTDPPGEFLTFGPTDASGATPDPVRAELSYQPVVAGGNESGANRSRSDAAPETQEARLDRLEAELGPLREPGRECLKGEDVLMTPEQGLQSSRAGTFDGVTPGDHDSKTNTYLWTIDDRGINTAMESTPFDTPRGNIVHTNLSSTASMGGEAWFGPDDTVTINAGSGRFGDGSGITEQQWNAAVDYWSAIGYKVNAVPFGRR